ncbi:MAG: NAD-dependent epimerase/dehydratase family protein [Chitinophagales bacterium]
MKVLIIGGYGYIGSKLAAKMNKEGHSVAIIDNLSNGSQNSVSFKHLSFIIDAEDSRCEDIFKNHSFDVVIHLACEKNKNCVQPLQSTLSSLCGLINLLQLSVNFKVKKFVFASSAAVYGDGAQVPFKEDSDCNPNSLDGINKLVGELYCQKWHEFYRLETVCLRISEVFGPGNYSRNTRGFFDIILDHMLDDHKLVIPDLHSSMDFIYINDVVDALYRAAFSDIRGIYNLSNNLPVGPEELISLMRDLDPLIEVDNQNKLPDQFTTWWLDNTGIKKTLDWVPMYSLEEGLRQTFDWRFTNRERISNEKAVKKTKFVSRMANSVILPYVENMLLLAGFLGLSYVSKGTLDETAASYLIYYIVIIGIVHGSRQLIISVLVSCAYYIFASMMHGRDIISLLYNTGSVLQLAFFILIGLLIGYFVDRKNQTIMEAANRFNLLKDRYKFLNEIHKQTMVIKDELQSQIANSEDSFGKIYNLTSQLDNVDSDNVFYSAISVIETVMKTDGVVLYTLGTSGCHLRLKAKSNKTGFEMPKSIKLDNHAYFQKVIAQKSVSVNDQFDPDIPIITGPILDSGQVVALVMLYDLPFQNLTLYHINLFCTVIKLISASIARASRYEEALAQQKLVPGTNLLKEDYLMNLIRVKQDARKRFGIEFKLLRSRTVEHDLKQLSSIIEKNLRDNDHAGLASDGNIYIVLSETEGPAALAVIDRLKNVGIDFYLVNEADFYAA